MRLPCRDGQDSIANRAFVLDEYQAVVAGKQSIPKYAVAPRKIVAAALDVGHVPQVLVHHSAHGNRQPT